MMKLIKRLWKEEEGQGMVEYALIIAVIAIALIAVMTTLKGSIANEFNKVGNSLT